MAQGAVLYVVSLCQGEEIMIYNSRHPSRVGAVAGSAIRREPTALVVWVLGGGIILLVATHAFRRCVGVIRSSVAVRAVLYVVSLCQGEEIVVNHRRRPTGIGGMAGGTVSRKTGTLVIWVLCGCIILLVATHTFRGGVGVITGRMALCTVLNIVSLGQGEEIVVDALRIPSET